MQRANKLLDFKNEGVIGYTGTKRRQNNRGKSLQEAGISQNTPHAWKKCFSLA